MFYVKEQQNVKINYYDNVQIFQQLFTLLIVAGTSSESYNLLLNQKHLQDMMSVNRL